MPPTPTDPVTLASCNENIPLLPITRQFDFGQFITLYHEDTTPQSADFGKPPRAIVITEQGGLAASSQAATRAAISAAHVEGQPAPTFVQVDRSTVDLFDVMDTEASSVQSSIQVTVSDVPAFLQAGTIDHDGQTYTVPIDDDLERTLSAGYSTVVDGSPAGSAAATMPLLLIPYVKAITVSSADLNRLIAGEPVTLDIPGRRGELDPSTLRALLDGQHAIIRAAGAGTRPAPVLVQLEEFQNRPAVADLAITDLADFLAHPQVPGRSGVPISAALTAETVDALRNEGVADVQVGTAAVRISVRASAASALNAVSIGGTSGSGIHTVATAPAATDRAREIMYGGMRDGTAVAFDPPRLPPGTKKVVPAAPAKKTLTDLVLPRLVPGSGLHVALFVPWRQTWKLKGFSRGNLLQSLAMTPLEEVTIEMHSWERRTRTLDQSSETDIEQSLESAQSTKDTEDIFNELTSKQDFSWQVEGSIDASYSNGVVTVNAAVAASAQNAQNLASVTKSTRNNMKEATSKASARVRAKRSTRITETMETGREDRVTRKIRNPNQCYTITYDFFETLAHYEIELEFMPKRLRLVAMLPNPIQHKDFTTMIVRTNETALMRALIDPALAGGFEAIRLTEAYAVAKSLLTDQALARKKEKSDLKADQKTEQSPAVTSPKVPTQEQVVLEILAQIKKSITTIYARANYEAAIGHINATIPMPVPIPGINPPLPELFRENFKYWLFVQLCSATLPGVFAALEEVRNSTTIDVALARTLVATLPGPGRTPTLSTLNDMTPAAKEDAGLSRAIWTVLGTSLRWPWFSGRCRDEGLYVANDLSIGSHCEALQKAFQDLEAKRAEGEMATAREVLVKQAEGKQDEAMVTDQLAMAFPIDELARAYERQEALLAHLNSYCDHYNYALFQALPPSEQATRIVTASQKKLRVGMFEPRVVAMDGKNLAVPLTSYAQSGMQAFVDYMSQELTKALSRPSDVAPEDWNDTVVVPTPGVTMSSRLGACSSCEPFIEKGRVHELRRLEAEANMAVAEAARRHLRNEKSVLGDPTSPDNAENTPS